MSIEQKDFTMHKNIEIKTERLFLRTLTEDDAALVKKNNDEFETEEAALEWIRGMRHAVMFYIWIAETNELIGRVYIHSKYDLNGEVEIGYGINENHRNKGYATEAAKAIVQFAFEQAEQEELVATISAENIASRRVIEKLGFTYCGVRTVFDNDEYREFEYFKLLRSEFILCNRKDSMEARDINKHSWNQQADRYQQGVDFSFDYVDYGTMNAKTEKDFNLIGDVKGKKILDLGCGGGNNSIALAKQGAIVTGVDISEEQINHARKNAEREGVSVNFIVSSMEDFAVNENEYDVVISMAALGYIENIEPVFQKISYTLKDRGIFVCSPPNALYSCIVARYLFDDPAENHSYFYTGPQKWKWEDEDEFEFYSYCRPISDYINILIDNSFYIKRVLELREIPESIETKEDELKALYPSVLVIKTIKVTDLRIL